METIRLIAWDMVDLMKANDDDYKSIIKVCYAEAKVAGYSIENYHRISGLQLERLNDRFQVTFPHGSASRYPAHVIGTLRDVCKAISTLETTVEEIAERLNL